MNQSMPSGQRSKPLYKNPLFLGMLAVSALIIIAGHILPIKTSRFQEKFFCSHFDRSYRMLFGGYSDYQNRELNVYGIDPYIDPNCGLRGADIDKPGTDRLYLW